MTVEHHIRVVFSDPEGTTIDRIRNFGEALWQAIHDDNMNLIDLEEIDLAVGAISLSVRVRNRKATMAIVEQLLQEHALRDEAKIEID